MNNKFIILLLVVSISGALILLGINTRNARKAATEETRPAAEASSDGLALRPPLEQNSLRPPLLVQTHAPQAQPATGAPAAGASAQPQTPPAGNALSPAGLRPAPSAEQAPQPASTQGQATTQRQTTAQNSAQGSAAAQNQTAAQGQAAAQQSKSAQQAATQAAPTKPARPKEKRITGIRINPSGAGVTVRIAATDSVTFKQSRLSSPERLVLDLEGVWKVRAPGVPENSLLSNVRIGKNPDRTRLVLDLKKKPGRVNVVKTANGLEVQLK